MIEQHPLSEFFYFFKIMFNQEKNQKNQARKRYLTRLREMYASALFQKFLKSGTFTMRTQGNEWYVSFTHEGVKHKAQGKTLAHAVITLSTKK